MAVVAILLSAGFAATALLSGPAGVAWAQTSPPTGCVTGGPVKAIATGGGDLTQFDIDEGQTLYYELQLRNNPNGSVMVASGLLEPDNPNADERNKLDNADVTVSPSVLFFNSSNWNQSQWVAVSAREDDGAVDGKAIVGHEAVGSPNDVTCVVVNEKDNDTPADPTPTPTPTPTATPEPASVGFVIAKPDGTPLTIKDINDSDFLGLYVANSGSASFVVSLATEPASDVPVNVTKHYDRFGTVNFSPARLDFTTSNWSTPQTITVSSTGPVPGRNGSAVLRLRADRDTEDEAYRQLVWADVRVREFDPPALLVSPNPLTVNEGSTASYGVRLHTKPTANVTVTLTEGTGSSDDTDVTVTSSKTLTFTSANYKSAQTVTVAAAHDDDLVSGFRVITHTAASDDAKYDGLTVQLTANENESDTAAIVVSANAVTVPEGGSATYTVKLSNQPSGDVNVSIATSPTGGGGDEDITRAPESLTFTANNWYLAQTVTLSAAPDGDDLNGTNTITHTAAGANFDAARQVFVTATEGDDDLRGFVVNPVPGPVTIEEGGSFSYTIKLGTQPTADVTVDFTVTAAENVDLWPNQAPITFTSVNWSTAQTVTFTADEDNSDYLDDTATIAHGVTTTDPIYAEQTIGDIAVTVTDNDAAIVLSANAVTVPENNSATYTVKLSHAPTADVTVTIAEGTGNDDDASLRVSSPSNKTLTFTTVNWNTAQTVRIYAAGDSDAVNGTRVINHTAAGGGFDSAPTFSVTAIERDSRAAIILRNAADTGNVSSINNVPENGSGVDYKVKLAAQPAGDVTVALSVTGDDDVSVQPASLTFTAGNYATLQTVTVSAATDADLLNGTATIAHTATGGGYDGLAAKNLSATETDTTGQIKVRDAGDSADITGISVPEGGSADYKVQLSHLPTGSVTVRLALQSTSDDGDGDITANKTVLYFNTGNWNTAQEVRLSAREDNDSLNGSRIITHTATGGGYNSPTKALTATEQDNEVGLTFTDTNGNKISALAVPENGSKDYQVSLKATPTQPVVVNLVVSGDLDITASSSNLSWTVEQAGESRTVTVSAPDDTDFVRGSATITHQASGGNYAGLNVDLPVTEVEDDVGIAIIPGALTIPEGGSATYTVGLGAGPEFGNDVTVALTGSGDDNITFSPASLTFTAGANGNWPTAQTVTVRAAADNDADNGTKTITHTAVTTDTHYSDVTATLVVTEGEPPLLVRNAGDTADITALTVNEGSSSGSGFASYKVKLSSQPSSSVTVHLDLQSTSGNNPGDSSINRSPSSLTFTTQNWSTAQTVKVWASNDSDQTNGSRAITHRVNGGGYTNAGSVVLTATERESTVADSPTAIWSNGTTMWVTSSGSSEEFIRAYTLATGAPDSSKDIPLHADNADPEGIWGNSSTIWVTDGNDKKLYAYNRSSKQRDSSKDITLHANQATPRGIWSNGTTMWVADSGGREEVWAYRLSSGSRNAARDYETLYAAGNRSPRSIWSDGETTWITDRTDGKVYAYNQLDKSRVSSRDYDLDPSNTRPTGIWSNGATMWVADEDDNRLYTYPNFAKNSLVGSNLGATAVTLTVSEHTGQWWYKSTTSGMTTCTDAGSAASARVAGLTKNTSYTFTAYSNSTCTTAIGTAALPFTTLTPTLRADATTNAGEVRLILWSWNVSQDGQWHYKHNQSGAQCSVAQSSINITVSGLTSGTVHVFSAYSDSNCSNLIVAADSSGVTPAGNQQAQQGPPASVSSVSATHNGDNVTASWPASDGATKYHVTYSDDGGASWSLAASEHAETSITINNADSTKSYIVGVRAGNDAGWSGWTDSNEAPAVDSPSPPGSVGSVSASRSNGNIAVSWNAADGATKYHVTYTDNGGQSWSLAALEHNTNSITISGADDDKAYVVGVRAGNDAGWSGWVNSNTVPAVQTPPGSVGSVSASRSNGNVVASWNAAAGATKYHVTYTDNGGQSWSLAALEHDTNSITISGADDDKAYVVGVRAGNDAGWSGWVNSNTVPAVQTPPGSVGSVSATHNGGAVSVSWAAASGATKYHVTYTDNGGASWSLAALEHSTTSITISGADSGKSYVVGVRAGNDAGWSGWVNSPPAKHSE